MWLKSESEVPQSCPILWDPMDCSLPGSSVHGIFQARVLEWVAIPFSRGSSGMCKCLPRSCIYSGWIFGSGNIGLKKTNILWFLGCVCVLSQHSTLCDPMDCSPLGSSVHGILQARRLEWVVMPSSRGSSWPRDQTCISWNAGDSSLLSHLGLVHVAKCSLEGCHTESCKLEQHSVILFKSHSF